MESKQFIKDNLHCTGIRDNEIAQGNFDSKRSCSIIDILGNI